MEKRKRGPWLGLVVLFVLSSACAGVPVRDAVKIDLSVPIGKIEGKQFTGIRYPF